MEPTTRVAAENSENKIGPNRTNTSSIPTPRTTAPIRSRFRIFLIVTYIVAGLWLAICREGQRNTVHIAAPGRRTPKLGKRNPQCNLYLNAYGTQHRFYPCASVVPCGSKLSATIIEPHA